MTLSSWGKEHVWALCSARGSGRRAVTLGQDRTIRRCLSAIKKAEKRKNNCKESQPHLINKKRRPLLYIKAIERKDRSGGSRKAHGRKIGKNGHNPNQETESA